MLFMYKVFGGKYVGQSCELRHDRDALLSAASSTGYQKEEFWSEVGTILYDTVTGFAAFLHLSPTDYLGSLIAQNELKTQRQHFHHRVPFQWAQWSRGQSLRLTTVYHCIDLRVASPVELAKGTDSVATLQCKSAPQPASCPISSHHNCGEVINNSVRYKIMMQLLDPDKMSQDFSSLNFCCCFLLKLKVNE